MTEETKNCPYCNGKILAAAIKCKHCKKMLNDFNKAKDIIINAKEMNFWQKLFGNYWIVKKHILKEFRYQNGYLKIESCSGLYIEGNINELEITLFNDRTYGRTIEVKKSQKEKIKFFIDSYAITNDEAEQIVELLQPKETKLSKALGILCVILDIFS